MVFLANVKCINIITLLCLIFSGLHGRMCLFLCVGLCMCLRCPKFSKSSVRLTFILHMHDLYSYNLLFGSCKVKNFDNYSFESFIWEKVTNASMSYTSSYHNSCTSYEISLFFVVVFYIFCNALLHFNPRLDPLTFHSFKVIKMYIPFPTFKNMGGCGLQKMLDRLTT